MSVSRLPPPRRLVFWQPIVSPHQRDFLEALAAAFPGEVTLAAERGLPAERIAMGWPPVVHERVRVVDASEPAAFERAVRADDPDTLHLFSGFFSHAIVWRAFRRLVPSSARLAMVSEAPEQRPATGWIKRLRGRWLVRRYAPRLEFALVMGAVGRRFFEATGFPGEKIVPFGYFLPVPERPWPPAEPEPTAGSPVRFLAAGQFIRRKGFDLLVEALRGLPAEGWECTIRGEGPWRRRLERRGASLGSDRLRSIDRLRSLDRLRFPGPLPNAELRAEIARADRVVVPSRHDGWAMLVNEALIAGTPVICSDACGAADLIDTPAAGVVVRAGDVEALAAALRAALAEGRVDGARRLAAHAVARRHDVGHAVATFLATIGGAR